MAALLREMIGDVLRRARSHRAARCVRYPIRRASASGICPRWSAAERKPSSELLASICGALGIPLSRVLIDAGDRMARREKAASVAGTATIDASTKVVIPQVASIAVA